MKQLTMADFPAAFTYRWLLVEHCGGDEGTMWDRYFGDGMDQEVRRRFESCLAPGVHTTAVMLRAFLRQIRKEEA
jgi:hypothetical protein